MLRLLHKFNCLMGRHMFQVRKQSRLCANRKLTCVKCERSFFEATGSLKPWDGDCESRSRVFKWASYD